MSTPLRALLLCAILTVPAIAFGQINIVNFDFGAVPIACPNGYAYVGPVDACPYAGPSQDFNQSPGFGWILGMSATPCCDHGGAGLTGPNTIFSPPPFNGMPFTQAVFLENRGVLVSQEISGFSAGSYLLSFYLGSRYVSGPYDGNQTVVALVDGEVIGTWALSSYTPFTLQTASFTVDRGGTHTLTFMGINPGDHTAFLSYAVITPTGR